jgi:hypothetical protein
MIGLLYSTSPRACMIRFIGGPYDGQSGLFDSCYVDQISFSHSDTRVTYNYVPLDKGRPIYRLDRTYRWGRDTSTSGVDGG